MSYVAVVRLFLSIVNALMRKANDKQQRAIGRDLAIKENLASVLISVRTGKRIDTESANYTEEEVDKILEGNFRD